MLPELDLDVAYLFYRLLHFLKQPFELDHISQFGVNIDIVDMVLPYIVFNKLPVSKESKLLLQRRLVLSSDIKLNKRGMNILHYFEKVKRKGYMDRGRIVELVECIFVKSFNEMVQENLVNMRRVAIPFCKSRRINIIEFILFFTRAIRRLAFYNMEINKSNHSCFNCFISFSTFLKVSHHLHLDQGINV